MKAKIPTKIQEKLLRNGELSVVLMSEEARKINEIIDYLYELTPYNDND